MRAIQCTAILCFLLLPVTNTFTINCPLSLRSCRIEPSPAAVSDDDDTHIQVDRLTDATAAAKEEEEEEKEVYQSRKAHILSRRDAFSLAKRAIVSAGTLSIGGTFGRQPPSAFAFAADGEFRPAKRAMAYRVDSTQPPTLIPLSTARKELRVLNDLGKGSGTDKEAILDDTVNLNNMLNKAVFGTIDAISALTSEDGKDLKSGPGFATFVCLGVPKATVPADIELAESIMDPILRTRGKRETALALAFCPLSSQADLDAFTKFGDESALIDRLTSKGVSAEEVQLYMPLLRYSRSKSLSLLAVAPELEDVITARTQGLQNVDPERRSEYVEDSEGFISLSATPKFRLYADRSLLKDFAPIGADDKPGDFFAERILVHEAGATAVAKFAVSRPESMVIVVAPTPDLRYLGGINGRIPRVFQHLRGIETSKVSDNEVTTILLNPTAKETLSLGRYLRLEIGTSPEVLEYQTKVSDYLWFSTMPKVNMLPRLMNG